MSARWFSVVALILAGCSGYSITGGPGKTAPPSLQSATALPEELSRLHVVFLMPVSVEQDAAAAAVDRAIFDRELREVLLTQCGVTVVDGAARPPASPADALKTAAAADADAVLTTKVMQYDLRKGSRLAADRPASVYFAMKLLRVPDGREIWRGSYAYKDQAWSDNLFRMGQLFAGRPRLGWLKADEILRQGFLSACRDFISPRGRPAAAVAP